MGEIGLHSVSTQISTWFNNSNQSTVLASVTAVRLANCHQAAARSYRHSAMLFQPPLKQNRCRGRKPRSAFCLVGNFQQIKVRVSESMISLMWDPQVFSSFSLITSSFCYYYIIIILNSNFNFHDASRPSFIFCPFWFRFFFILVLSSVRTR